MHKIGEHEREEDLYQLGLEVCPEIRGANDQLLNAQAICALSQGDSALANERLLHIRKRIVDLGYPDYVPEFFIAYIYEDAAMPEESIKSFENLYRKAPKGDRIATYNYGRCLIENDLDMEKGIELVDQVLDQVTPDSKLYYVYTYEKSKALYKLERYEEAKQLLDIAEEGWVGYYPDLHEFKQDLESALAF